MGCYSTNFSWQASGYILVLFLSNTELFSIKCQPRRRKNIRRRSTEDVRREKKKHKKKDHDSEGAGAKKKKKEKKKKRHMTKIHNEALFLGVISFDALK